MHNVYYQLRKACPGREHAHISDMGGLSPNTYVRPSDHVPSEHISRPVVNVLTARPVVAMAWIVAVRHLCHEFQKSVGAHALEGDGGQACGGKGGEWGKKKYGGAWATFGS